MPKVSVVIPTYNRQAYIRRALDSVLAQTFTDYEVVVVDDGSTDDTKGVLKDYEGRIKCVHQANGGIASARNRGIAESSAPYIAFLDSDDWWGPQKLEHQVRVLDEHPNVGIVYGRMPIVNERGQTIGQKPAGVSGRNFQELIEVWGDLPTSTVMTRRACFEQAGNFDSGVIPMEDIDMWLRISRHYDLYEIEGEPLAFYFRHDSQVTTSPIRVYEGLVNIYTKILNSYTDIPVERMVKRIAENQYTLSRVYYREKMYGKSLQHVKAALARYPLAGTLFFSPGDSFIAKAVKFVKPYGFFLVCLWKNAEGRK